MAHLVAWARNLLLSPRLRDADAGARLVRLVAEKYAARLGWRVLLWPELLVQPPGGAGAQGVGNGGSAGAPPMWGCVLALARSLAHEADRLAQLGQADAAAAARMGMAHGPLLAMRFIVDDLPWPTLAAADGSSDGRPCGSTPGEPAATPAAGARGAPGTCAASAPGFGGAEDARTFVADALALVRSAAAAALPPLARQDSNVAAADVEELSGEEGDEGDAGDDDDGGGCEGGDLGPVPQLVNTACWTTLKEVAALTAALAQRVPLPHGGVGSSCGGAAGGEPTAGSQQAGSRPPSPGQGIGLLSVAQLDAAGSLLVDLLLALKHNGAVDKVQTGLSLLTARLLRCDNAELALLPRRWMAAVFDHMLRPGGRGAGGGGCLGPRGLGGGPGWASLLFLAAWGGRSSTRVRCAQHCLHATRSWAAAHRGQMARSSPCSARHQLRFCSVQHTSVPRCDRAQARPWTTLCGAQGGCPTR